MEPSNKRVKTEEVGSSNIGGGGRGGGGGSPPTNPSNTTTNATSPLKSEDVNDQMT